VFDFSFSEIVVIGVVALVVVGPQRLPHVARTAGVWLGRLQRYVHQVKEDINREIQLEELKKMQDEIANRVRQMETTMKTQLSETHTQLQQALTPPEQVNPEGDHPIATDPPASQDVGPATHEAGVNLQSHAGAQHNTP
jgi:sec-independent protein translocase protein TatB